VYTLTKRIIAPRDRNAKVLDQDALDLVQSDRMAGAVMHLGCARRLVVGDPLRTLDYTTVLKMGGNPGSPERVTTGRHRQYGCERSGQFPALRMSGRLAAI
jgi:hypothetical protein